MATVTGCCPPFDPSQWDDKVVTWQDKPFLKARVRSVFHVPLRMSKIVPRAMAQIEGAGANPSRRLMLADDQSPWHTDLYIEVTSDVPGANMARLSGTFLTRVFDGPYRDTPKWAAEMKLEVKARGGSLERLYFGWTMCPRCARAYGHNYVVVFAQVEPGHETGMAGWRTPLFRPCTDWSPPAQMRPSATMDRATRRKPAMLAPLT
jgi:hypothetical protein